MNISLPTVKSEIPAVCRMLRTKNAYANYGDDTDVAPWQLGESSTAVYWCLKTMQHAGPDDGLAHPHDCLARRRCYRASE